MVRMLSELQTNVCCLDHLSGTRAEKRMREEEGRKRNKELVEKRWSTREKRQIRESEGGGVCVCVWWGEMFTASSLSIHGALPAVRSARNTKHRYPSLHPHPPPHGLSPPLRPLTALLISTEQVSKATHQEVRG